MLERIGLTKDPSRLVSRRCFLDLLATNDDNP